jgi:hypothetical protein
MANVAIDGWLLMENQIFVIDCPYTARSPMLRRIRCPSETHLQHAMTIAPTKVFLTGF